MSTDNPGASNLDQELLDFGNDRPPSGWFALDVMRKESRKWDWVALMVDVHPDELKHCLFKTAFLYVHPNEYRPDGSRTAREA